MSSFIGNGYMQMPPARAELLDLFNKHATDSSSLGGWGNVKLMQIGFINVHDGERIHFVAPVVDKREVWRKKFTARSGKPMLQGGHYCHVRVCRCPGFAPNQGEGFRVE